MTKTIPSQLHPTDLVKLEQIFQDIKNHKIKTDSELLTAFGDLPLDSRNKDGEAAVHIAAAANNEDILKTLISQKVNPSTQTEMVYSNPNRTRFYGETPLHFAASRGCIAAIKFLAGLGGVDINAPDYNGSTPLHHANAESVKTLVGLGAGLDLTNGFGQTPLRLAAVNGSTKKVKELIECGALTTREQLIQDIQSDSSRKFNNTKAISTLVAAFHLMKDGIKPENIFHKYACESLLVECSKLLPNRGIFDQLKTLRDQAALPTKILKPKSLLQTKEESTPKIFNPLTLFENTVISIIDAMVSGKNESKYQGQEIKFLDGEPNAIDSNDSSKLTALIPQHILTDLKPIFQLAQSAGKIHKANEPTPPQPSTSPNSPSSPHPVKDFIYKHFV